MGRVAFVSILLAAFLIGGCENPRKLVITAANQDEVLQKVGQSKKLSDEEKRLFASAVMREGMAKAMGEAFGKPAETRAGLVGKSVGQIIEEERKLEAERREREAREKQLAEEAHQREEVRLKALREAVLVAPFSIAEQRDGFMTAFEIKYAVENASGREIRAFEGTMRFRDVLGDQIAEGHLKVTEPLKAGEKRSITDHEPFAYGLRGKKLSDVKAEWIPETVLFADGQRIQREENASP